VAEAEDAAAVVLPWSTPGVAAQDGIVTDNSPTASARLVFGDDGSTGADVAWLWIVEHAWPGWTVDVVTAVAPPLGPPPTTEQRSLRAWTPPLPRHAPAEVALDAVRHLTITADPRLALDIASDLTVIGAQGAGVMKSLHFGSTAEWLLHDPPASLVVARHGHRTRRVLACADGSRHAAVALAALAAVPWIDEVEVRVLVVADGLVDVRAATAAAETALGGTQASVEVVHRRGSASSAALAEIAAHAPDLVALGTRGLSGWQRLRLGSTTNAVARGTTCSVLVATADG
jgi:nucleotide-binding universal stress UspA family protein